MVADKIKKVDKLTITFLVDNSIEWFTKLPPGFTHEIKIHLGEHSPAVNPVTGAPILDFEKFCCGAHGFSALIETQVEGSEPQLTLFDTGPESRSIARNIASLQIPVQRISRVVLSHWHSDHSGGLLSFLRIRKAAFADPDCDPVNPGLVVVDLHPDRPIARGIAPGGPTKVIGQLATDPRFEEIEELDGFIEKHSKEHLVAEDTVYVSGEIPRVTPWEQGLLGAVRWVGDEESKRGEWVEEEQIMDERYALVDVKGKGLVIFSACSHAGIVNVVRDAIVNFKRPIHMVIGGLHLATPDLVDRIEPTVQFLADKVRPAPTYVLPMHCTGFQAKAALEKALGEGCVPAGTGIRVEVTGDGEVEKRIFAPTISL
ncbi:beta-lactamase-like protein [Cristinia sonorae]|uniref:Beta-lactamase-like protein n=1 Tax=Cristinia sonorae TaxID=1940300 RepID=A0A8K0UDH2_9AGAR|nr:beta-lactamase-like protein [Cristinia sonorae]